MRNIPGHPRGFDEARLGLRELLRQAGIAPPAVLACAHLIALASPGPGERSNDSRAAVVVSAAVDRALDKTPERDAARALFGATRATAGQPLGHRRAAAAEIVQVKPESFRVRREARILDDVARALLVELAFEDDAPASLTTAEVQLEEQTRSRGAPYVRFRDGDRFKVIALTGTTMTIGRGHCDIEVLRDRRVSRRHAQLSLEGDAWSVRDLGSTNGTFVGDRAVTGDVRLGDGDVIVVGDTAVTYCDAGRYVSFATSVARVQTNPLTPSPTQRKVLVELARPWLVRSEGAPVTPSNSEIARRLGYSAKTVATAIGEMYARAGLTRSHTERQRRVELVRLAIGERIVSADDTSQQ
jgi:pSer/pThr/pTyr-binding forkhead associated (FHA) protein